MRVFNGKSDSAANGVPKEVFLLGGRLPRSGFAGFLWDHSGIGRILSPRKPELLDWKQFRNLPAERDAIVAEIHRVLRRSKDYDPKAIERMAALLDEKFGNSMRANGKMEAKCHSLRVALRIAIITRKTLYAIQAGVHDLKEDGGMTAQQVSAAICPGAGDLLDHMSNPVTHESGDADYFKSFMNELLSSTKVRAIVMKIAADVLENLCDLDGCPQDKVLRTTQKGILAAEIASAIHPDLYAEYIWALRTYGHPDLQQNVVDLVAKVGARRADEEKLGLKDKVPSRKAGITRELIDKMPIAGSNTIAVTDDGAILVPYSSGLSEKQAIAAINSLFSLLNLGVQWARAPSHFPVSLQCYHVIVPITNEYIMTDSHFREFRDAAVKWLPSIIFPGKFNQPI
jgi:hypothetical protein